MGSGRYMYNWMLNEIVNNNEKANATDLRNKYTPKDKIPKSKNWLLNTPKEVRTEAIKEVCTNVATNRKKVKNGDIPSFNMNYKTKKSLTNTITIPKSAVKYENNKLVIYKTLLGNIKIPKREKIPLIDSDIKLMMCKPNIWFVVIPYSRNDVIKSDENQITRVISLDPGSRTFLTGYSPSGTVIEIGKNDINRIFRLCLIVDKLKSKIDDKNIKCRKRLRILKKMRSLQRRIHNLKRELHYQAANYLYKNYDIILLPKFDSSIMIKKINRKINSKTVRKLVNLNHGEFRQRMLEKEKDYESKKLLIVNEAYTTQTCTKCGYLKKNIGGRKTFKCNKCRIVIDRDINGSRNILLRSLSL